MMRKKWIFSIIFNKNFFFFSLIYWKIRILFMILYNLLTLSVISIRMLSYFTNKNLQNKKGICLMNHQVRKSLNQSTSNINSFSPHLSIDRLRHTIESLRVTMYLKLLKDWSLGWALVNAFIVYSYAIRKRIGLESTTCPR